MQRTENALYTRRSKSLDTLRTLFEMKETRQLCDASVVLENGTEIPIHSAILCACSAYFRAYFTTSLNHLKKGNKVKVTGVSPEIMHMLIDYVYLRKLDLNETNIYEVLIAADYLSILGALSSCCQFLSDILNTSNCFTVLFFARNYVCTDLENDAWTFIMKNFVQILEENPEWVDLPLEDVLKILKSDVLNVKSEETAWEAVLKWIERDIDNRKEKIMELLPTVRLGLLDTQYFLTNIRDHPLICDKPDCGPITQTLQFLYDIETMMEKSSEMVTPELARPRLPHEILFAIGGWSGGSATGFIESYDIRADRWIRVESVDPAGGRAYHSTAVVKKLIYIIGGFDGVEYFNSCRCFNPCTKIWREVAPMHARRCYVSTTVLDDVIYAMGGYDGQHRQNTVEIYESTTNQWTFIASMNMQRSDASACSLNGKIYITGGFNGQECLHSAEVYDPLVDQWTLISAMRTRRSGVSCVAYHGYVYVIGGFNGVSRMCSGERYCPESDTWTAIPDMYNPRSNFAVEVADDMIFAIGGFNGITTIYHVECYDDKTNEWYEATDMNIFRSALSACVVSDLPNSLDYIHQHRDCLMEEKRQKMLALENQRQQIEQAPPLPAIHVPALNFQQLHVIQQLRNQGNDPFPLMMEVDDDDNVEDNNIDPNRAINIFDNNNNNNNNNNGTENNTN